jgi:hypothetical protein
VESPATSTTVTKRRHGDSEILRHGRGDLRASLSHEFGDLEQSTDPKDERSSKPASHRFEAVPAFDVVGSWKRAVDGGLRERSHPARIVDPGLDSQER